MLISIRHVTTYQYEEEASYSIQSLRLWPPSFDGQTVDDWSVSASETKIDPLSRDSYGNQVGLANTSGTHDGVTIEARGAVSIEDRSGIVSGLWEPVSPKVFLRDTPATKPNEHIHELAKSTAGGTPLQRLHSLSRLIDTHMTYETGTTDAGTKAVDALQNGRGVCQDYAQIFISAARFLGLPSRYVTGYLVTDTPDGSHAHHAWAESWIKNLGWIGFDVVNNVCPTDHYVRLSWGMDASDAAPVRGLRRGGCQEDLSVRVCVTPDSQGGAQQ